MATLQKRLTKFEANQNLQLFQQLCGRLFPKRILYVEFFHLPRQFTNVPRQLVVSAQRKGQIQLDGTNCDF